MIKDQYICINGEFFRKNDPVLKVTNRAFLYGDALFETIHANGTSLQFLEDHLIRLKYSMIILQMHIPEVIENGKIESVIKRLLNRNKLLKGARIRLTLFRNKGGKYTPIDNDSSYLIETEELSEELYAINPEGITLTVYPDIPKPVNKLSNLKTTNALLYTLAGNYAKNRNLNDAILLNSSGYVVEATSSNIFMVKDNEIYTPPLSDGCVAGIMRKQILKICDQKGYLIFNNISLKTDYLEEADELFLTNSIKGIQWVVAFNERRYYSRISKNLIPEINNLAFGN